MRYDSVPTVTVSNMVPLNDMVMPQEISLDLSLRKKIVIRPLLQRNALSSVRPSSKPLVVGTSIFSRKYSERSVVATPNINSKAKDPPKAVQKQLAVTSRSTTPPKRSRVSDTARVAKLGKAKEAMTQAFLGKRCQMLAVQKPVSNFVSTVALSNEGSSLSQFSEEYAKCGCNINGRPQCQRCRFLRLTDRFCNLVNAQCEKWNMQM
ncbi:hypothetical protein GALMADRAFT_249043 [Galerina marginata CBS 339.88]|uniref:Uncharacterized protein n=1 Tax=Galerina marginata (strain CBS 339.88) TaxID=685588 RepID=A0A067T7Z7_GALM3|nr:hypothetical protein GALMADRAFT_249043 [Galerina marginata CBS 339.88]